MNPREAELKPPRELALMAKVKPFNRQAEELHKFLFLARSALSFLMNEGTFILFVFRRDTAAGGKK